MKTKLIIPIIASLILVNIVLAQYQAPYDTTNLTNAEDIYEQGFYLNELLGGLLGIGMLIVIFGISFIITTTNTGDALNGMISALYISAIVGLIFLPLKLISPYHYIFIIALLAITAGAKILVQK